jgi:hypothetical protein
MKHKNFISVQFKAIITEIIHLAYLTTIMIFSKTLNRVR